MDSAGRIHRVVLIPGDGIGPEVTRAVCRIFEAAEAPIAWEEHAAGVVALRAGHDLLSEETVEAIRHVQVALKGPCTTPVGEGFTSINVQLRKRLNLYAAVRPVRNLDGVPSRFDNVDLIIIRENTEGLYSGVENHVTDGRGDEHESGHGGCLRADRSLGIPFRHSPPPPQDHGLPQGQHHEADRRPVPPLCPKGP